MITCYSAVFPVSEPKATHGAIGFKAGRSCCDLIQPVKENAVSFFGMWRGARVFHCLQGWAPGPALPPPTQPLLYRDGSKGLGACSLSGLYAHAPASPPRPWAHSHSHEVLQTLQYHSVSGEVQISKYHVSGMSFFHPVLWPFIYCATFKTILSLVCVFYLFLIKGRGEVIKRYHLLLKLVPEIL